MHNQYSECTLSGRHVAIVRASIRGASNVYQFQIAFNHDKSRAKGSSLYPSLYSDFNYIAFANSVPSGAITYLMA